MLTNQVRQSHDPRRKLSSHVVQVRNKAQSETQKRLGRLEMSREQLRQELRRAVENTRSV